MPTLAKATLECLDRKPIDYDPPDIVFMFNPQELVFERSLETSDNPGSRSQERGIPKVSFSHTKACKITIKNIMFDTYEEGVNVFTRFEPFRKAVEFAKGKERPPIYRLKWGSQVYLRRCFIEQLNYKLTMFLSDGTPVRAVIDSLTLKEIADHQLSGSLRLDNTKDKFSENLSRVRREIDSLYNRKQSRNNPNANKMKKYYY